MSVASPEYSDVILSRPSVVRRSVDLGFSRWETVAPKERSPYFDVYFARPRGRNVPCAFLLKALKPQFCASAVGAALIERERFLGSVPCPRLLPVVDFVRPRRLSATQARRGCVVVPLFSGRTLAERLNSGERFSTQTLQTLERQLKQALSELHRRGWSSGELTPERVLLADAISPDASSTATLVDFSEARRFETPSLLLDSRRGDSFDPNFELAPDVFFDPVASPQRDAQSLARLLSALQNKKVETTNNVERSEFQKKRFAA